MNKEYYVEFDDIICRKANKDDNLEEIAALIYETDPYIYPYWFNGSVEEAIEFLVPKLTMPGFVFNLNNAYIAIDKETSEILGLVIAYDKDTDLDFDYTPYLDLGESYKVTINEYVLECIECAKTHDVMYFMNTAISKDARSMGIGKKLLGSVSDYFEEIGYTSLKSECLIHNLPIINLCHSLGFKETDEVNGFNKYDDNKIDVVNVLRSSKKEEATLEDDLIFRKANKDDNLEKIASLIYQTDPYIYPYWFDNSEEAAIEFLKEEMLKPGFVFNIDNINLSIDKNTNEIVGIIVALSNETNLEYDYSKLESINDNYKNAIEKYVKNVLSEVEENDELYIMCCTVDKNVRGRNIGSRMLKQFLEEKEKEGFENFGLDCLLHNLPAKNLYHDMGFVEIREFQDFGGYSEEQPTVTFKRRKDKMLKEEFQEKQNFKYLRK